MKKVAEIKRKQGFVKKSPNCGNCSYFTSEFVPNEWNPDYEKEKKSSLFYREFQSR